VPDGSFPFEASFGPRHAQRLPPYHRLDVKASRHFRFDNGSATLFVELINLYNRGNVQARFPDQVRWQGPGNPVELIGTFDEEWLPLLPSIGFRWDF
jgi:hypothetical protein